MFCSKFTCVCYTVAKVRLKLFENEARKMHVSCHLHWISMFPLKDQIFCGPSICFAIKLFSCKFILLFAFPTQKRNDVYPLFFVRTFHCRRNFFFHFVHFKDFKKFSCPLFTRSVIDWCSRSWLKEKLSKGKISSFIFTFLAKGR